MEFTILLLFLTLMRFVSLALGGITFAMYLIIVIQVIKSALNDEAEFEDYWYFLALCLYGLVFSVLIVFTELRLGVFFKHFGSLLNWAIRGMFYVFVGIMAIAVLEGTFEFRDFNRDQIDDFIRYAAYTLIIIGLVYTLLEIVCLRSRAENQIKNKKGQPNFV